MAANNQPIYSKAINRNGAFIAATATAKTTSDGAGTIGTDMFLVWTADATNGGICRKIRAMQVASVANTLTSANVIRFYVSTVASGVTTSANTRCIQELTIPSLTAASSTTQVNPMDAVFNEGFQLGDTILASVHVVPAANTGIQLSSFGGSF